MTEQHARSTASYTRLQQGGHYPGSSEAAKRTQDAAARSTAMLG